MSLSRLLQLASPALPVGAYSYSQGLEAAVEAGIVRDASSAEQWIGDVLEFSLAALEAPLLHQMMLAPDAIERLNAVFLSTRETAELRAETVQMGHSLRLLLTELGVATPAMSECSYPAAYASAAVAWKLSPKDALVAYLWSWLENQVMAALKAVPLGQTAGQKILARLGSRLSALADEASTRPEAEWRNFVPGLAVLSA